MTDGERAILEFAHREFRYAGTQEEEIRRRFGLSATAYFQRLNALLDRPEALEYDPVLVNRLLRLREKRQAARSARRAGLDKQSMA
jgi:hypothetical protein